MNYGMSIEVENDSFGLDPNEQIVCLLRKINESQQKLIDLQIGANEMLSNMRDMIG